MKPHIDSHHLRGDGIREQLSPNAGGPFATAPDTLVLHYTAGDSTEWAIDILRDATSGNRVSAHLVVARDGSVTQLLPFDTIAWHAGQSSWGGRSDYNQFSLGIEIDNAGRLEPRDGELVSWRGQAYARQEAVRAVHRNETEPSWWHRYPEAQLEVVEELCELLVAEYDLRWILGHEEIAPQRKQDPGPAFPLDGLRTRVFGGPLARRADDDGEEV